LQKECPVPSVGGGERHTLLLGSCFGFESFLALVLGFPIFHPVGGFVLKRVLCWNNIRILSVLFRVMGQGNIIKLIRIKVWSRRLRIVDGCIHPLNVVGRLPSRHRLECYRVFFGCKSDTFRSRLFTVVLFVQWTLVQVPHVSIEFPTPRQDNLWRRWWHLETTMCQIQLFDLLRSSMEERVLYLRLEKGRAVTRRLASRLCHSLEGERLYFP